MRITNQQIDEIAARVQEEGDPVLELAPLKRPPSGLPTEWMTMLSQDDAHKKVLDVLWKPMERRLPRVMTQLRRSLDAVGVLTTKTKPPSLIYFFHQDTTVYAFRGWIPAAPTLREAAQLPAEFVEFYTKLHDGWLDVFAGAMGVLPGADWFWLGADPTKPASRFLVVFMKGAPASLGFDFRHSPPICYAVWSSGTPEVVPYVWAKLDEWLGLYLEDMHSA